MLDCGKRAICLVRDGRSIITAGDGDMTGKAFLNAVANGQDDVLALLIGLLHSIGADYCVIGGLAVNAYVEPVVSLDLDVVVVTAQIDRVCAAAAAAGLKVETFAHSVNLSSSRSDLRIQIQMDERYQEFIRRAESKTVLGYDMRVAAIEDALQGKVWAYSDSTRRKSKRQKDLADILRLVEAYPHLISKLPVSLRKEIE
jgi:hypothetical protein